MRPLHKPAALDTTVIPYVDGHYVVRVQGELDLYTAADLRDRLLHLLNEHHNRITVDCAAVEFIDSTGLGVLVGALKRARASGGDVVLAKVPANPMRVLELTGLTKVFTIDPSS